MQKFKQSDLQKLSIPDKKSTKNDNGQVIIIGGSKLFHGAPLLALKTASRFVDMVFFTSPESEMNKIARQIKANLASFIWVPMNEVEEYIKKADAVLIGPGLMRFHSEKDNPGEFNNHADKAFQKTASLTKNLLAKFPDKRWVIDAGSLQTMKPTWIPDNAIITPNQKEFRYLFADQAPENMANKYGCTIVYKAPTNVIYSPDKTTEIPGGNPGLTKGGTGDTLAGLTVALFAKNDAHLAASAASFILKNAADELYQEVGPHYNSDDLANQIPQTLQQLLKKA